MGVRGHMKINWWYVGSQLLITGGGFAGVYALVKGELRSFREWAAGRRDRHNGVAGRHVADSGLPPGEGPVPEDCPTASPMTP